MTRTRTLNTAAVALVAFGMAVGISACGDDEPAPTSSSTLQPAPGGSAVDPSDAGSSELGDDEPSPIQVDADQLAAAQKAAEATMAVWIKGKSLEQQDWHDKLTDTLAPEAQPDFEYRYGYKIPDTKIVGETKALNATSEYATFEVTTNKRTLQVTVLPIGGGKWATSAIVDSQSGEAV